jgi:hypothetical protein
VVIAIIGLAFGVWISGEKTSLFSNASGETGLVDMEITNISESGFVVSWSSNVATTGFVKVKENKLLEFERVLADDRDQESGRIENYFMHYITVKNLSPNTEYLVRPGAGRMIGEETIVKTGPIIHTLPQADIAFGQVTTAGGNPAGGVVVYATLGEGVEMATLTRTSGSWVIPLSTTRTKDLSKFLVYDKKNAEVKFRVEGANLGRAEVSTKTDKDAPVPVITLGENANDTGSSSHLTLSIDVPKNKEVTTSRKVVGETAPETKVKVVVDGKFDFESISDKTGRIEFEMTGISDGTHTLVAQATTKGRAAVVIREFSLALTE